MTEYIIINSNQRRKIVLGKAFNNCHDLTDLVFRNSFDNKYNAFINLYEQTKSFTDNNQLKFEVKTEFSEKVYLKWEHGQLGPDGYHLGMKFPSFITYMKSPTKEEEPKKLVDIDIKNLDLVVDLETMTKYKEFVKLIEDANIQNRLISPKEVADLHDMVCNIGSMIRDEYSKYSWVGGVFWGGRGFSYYGDWNPELMKSLSDANLVDPVTNIGKEGYFAQRLSSVQLNKPTLVTNYLCDNTYDAFKFCCPAFFMLKGDRMYELIDKYYKMNFVTTYKATIPFDKLLKWQDSGETDLKIWENWQKDLSKIEEEIRNILFS